MRYALALSLLVLPATAQARDDAAYIQIEGGLTDIKSVDWTISGVQGANQTNFHTGQFDAGVSAGYDFGKLRAEGEVFFQRSRIHDYTLRQPTKLNINPTLPAGFYPSTTGYVHRASAMANVIAETGGNKRIGLYAGLGVGVTRVRLDNWRIAGVDPFLNGDSTKFAWQAFTGARVPVSKHIELGVKIRHHAGRKFRYTSRQGLEPFVGNFTSNSWLATAAWNF